MENQEKENTSQPRVTLFNKDVDSWSKDEKGDEDKKDNTKENTEGSIKEKRNYTYHYHNHHHCHDRNSGGLFGLTVLFLGVLFLLNNLGYVGKEIWSYILPYWPVLLVLAGVRIITGYNRFISFIVFLIALALFSLIVLHALILTGSPLIYNLNLPPDFINFISQLK